jgi:hypothetical protein
MQSFIVQLKNHLLSRIQGVSRAGEELSFSNEVRNQLYFQHDRIYRHAVLRVNYTTYDVRREQDYINPRTSKRYIMLESNEDTSEASLSHPFWYAQVLGIFHAQVQLLTAGQLSPPKRMDFLWVRWLGLDPGYRSGWRAKRLDRVGFVPHNDPEAFGFLDPDCVLRACHLIPAFVQGHTTELCPPSVARDDDGDWTRFYVNRCVSCVHNQNL